jgi:enoyl-CoA hydratase
MELEMDSPVSFQKTEHVALITLLKPWIDLAAAQELAAIAANVNADPDISVVMLSGSNGCFCRGGDSRQILTVLSEQPAVLSMGPAEAIAAINVPTLAAVDGEALGIGLELALACDLRLASERSSFGLTQIGEGTLPMDGGTQRLPRVVGRGKAAEMVLTGEVLDASQAFDAGLVNKIVSSEKLQTEAQNLAKTLAAKAPFALRYCKEAVNKGLDLTLDQGLRLEADLYFLLHTTSDRTEGIKSFLARKAPEYKGQ